MPIDRRVPASRPLVVSTDEALLDDLLRLLAAAGAEPEVATGGVALRRAHHEATLVLLGADVLSAPVITALPRRPGVVVVAGGDLPASGWAAAVELGAERVAVLPHDEPWLMARAADAARGPIERGWVVAVTGSCGGAGASTVATALALSAAPGALLVDGDPWGGGLDLLLGAERAEGLRWPELTGLRGRVEGDAVLAALPEVAGVHVLAADRRAPVAVPADALTAVVEAACSAGRPVVLDVARPGHPTTGPDVGSAPLVPGSAPAAGIAQVAGIAQAAAEAPGVPAAVAGADLALLVVPARLRAATAARMLVEAADPPWGRAHLVVRPVPGGLAPAEVAEVVGRPVLAQLSHDRSAVPRGERGEPPVVAPRSPLGALARRVLAVLPDAGAGR